MMVTEKCVALVAAYEGYFAEKYKCPAGVWTQGYGHTNAAGAPKVGEPALWSKSFAQRVLRDDLNRFAAGVAKLLKRQPSPHEFDAMVSFAFNVGLGNFAKSSVLRKFNAGDLAGAARAFGMWTKARDPRTGAMVELKGLVRRRASEALLFKDVKDRDFTSTIERGEPAAGKMPQKVDPPEPPKPMSQSKTGNTAIAIGAGGAIAAGKEVVSTINDMKDAANDAGGLVGLAGSSAVLIGFFLLIAAGAAFIWWDRRRKLLEDGV